EVQQAINQAISQESSANITALLTEEKPKEVKITITIPQQVLEDIKKLPGTLEGVFYDENWNPIERIQVRDIVQKLESTNDNRIKYIVFDGVITQRLVDLASSKNIKMLIGARIGGITKRPKDLELLSLTDIIS
ncbi:MAG: DNA primase, partial [Sulfolobaceae archaeon]